MKTSRAAIGRDVALPDSFHSFFSFPAVKGGYSGVAVYTDTRTATPLKAEEGLSGGLQPKPPLSPEERISTSYPLAHELKLVPDADDQKPNDLVSLDLEGRAIVLDFGLFVLINLYCPNEGSDARFPYKMNYHLMLQERVRELTAAGREVVVVGDLNVCAAPIDHCDGHLPSNASTFWEHPARAWMRDWLAPRGPLIDVLRKFWPDRKGMYTCTFAACSAQWHLSQDGTISTQVGILRSAHAKPTMARASITCSSRQAYSLGLRPLTSSHPSKAQTIVPYSSIFMRRSPPTPAKGSSYASACTWMWTLRSVSLQDWRPSIGPSFRESRRSCRASLPSASQRRLPLQLCRQTGCLPWRLLSVRWKRNLHRCPSKSRLHRTPHNHCPLRANPISNSRYLHPHPQLRCRPQQARLLSNHHRSPASPASAHVQTLLLQERRNRRSSKRGKRSSPLSSPSHRQPPLRPPRHQQKRRHPVGVRRPRSSTSARTAKRCRLHCLRSHQTSVCPQRTTLPRPAKARGAKKTARRPGPRSSSLCRRHSATCIRSRQRSSA